MNREHALLLDLCEYQKAEIARLQAQLRAMNEPVAGAQITVNV